MCAYTGISPLCKGACLTVGSGFGYLEDSSVALNPKAA